MRVLLIHPEDELLDGPWAGLAWDRIVDLGLSGEIGYRNAAQKFGTEVSSLNDLRSEDFQELRRVRELLGAGSGRLKDSTGLDWWDLTAIIIPQQLETIVLLQKLIATLGPGDEVHVSRPSIHADVLALKLGPSLHVFPSRTNPGRRGLAHYFQLVKKFPPRQLLGIFWDKMDAGYQFRGPLSARRKPAATPVVLLPTAYVNVSKTAISYARVLPETRFLLVATRRSGWVDELPANVSRAWLRSYSSGKRKGRKAEYLELVERWRSLREELEGIAEFEILSRLGYFEQFPFQFARGLEMRDAWRNVFEREPVESVLCADDSNSYTRIPLLLAAQRNLPSISCHHGALDGLSLFKRSRGGLTLVKGRMERDYLTRVCGMPESEIEVGAPTAPLGPQTEVGSAAKSAIIFFSESYEVSGGRAKDFYEDVLPRLADIALAEGKQLIVKLHPFESLAERTGMVNLVLRPHRRKIVTVLGGALTTDLWNKAWFGITVLSTVAVEGALRGVPCFLCGWLEASRYGFVDQFSKFGAGIPLSGTGEIEKIPAMLRVYKPSATIEQDLSRRIEPQRLRNLLRARAELELAVSARGHRKIGG
jgi:hypothetical protein